MDSILQTLIQDYGYLAVFLGTFLEGETLLLIGGFAAHRGYLELPWVLAAAFSGSLLGDQLYFHLGRRYGDALLARSPYWIPQVERVKRLMERFHSPLILGIRFMYGIRVIGPMVMGMSTLSARRFFVLNTLVAPIWALVVGLAGYLLGEALKAMLGKLEHIELAIFGGIALVGVIVWAARLLLRRE